MNLLTISSGSQGNAYILQASDGKSLLLELGVSFTRIKEALNFDTIGIVCALCSHVHLDHSLSIPDALKYGIDVFGCDEVKERYNGVKKINNDGVEIGGFEIIPFKLYHDAECIGFLISHNEMGRMIFATDTCIIPYKFKGIDHFLVEANFSEDVAEKNMVNFELNYSQLSRLRETHMSIEKTLEFLSKNVCGKTKNVLLLHLSNKNSDENLFPEMVKDKFGINNVFVADKGLKIELNKYLF